MLAKVKKAFSKYEMLKYENKVTVALSGGADSVCLLYVLKELANEYGIILSAVHVNHLLRGKESNRDQAFVEELCKREEVPLKTERINVTEKAKTSGQSIELAARNARYEVFAKIEGLVATAHSADDNLETVLYNITRGTGLKGVAGIPPKRDNLIRPLIFCTRQEIEAYLKEKEIAFVVDSSNLTDDYTRNFLRHNVVPVLKKINPSAPETVASMSANLREDEEFLDTSAKRIYLLVSRQDFLDAQLLKIQPPSIIKRVIALYLEERFSLKTDSLHLENCKEVLLSGGKTSMNGNMTAICKGERFYFVSNSETPVQTQYEVQQKEVLLENFSNVNKLFLKNAIDCDKINGNITVRTRNASDEIRLNGRGCTKSLKKLMNELKILEEQRNSLPVAADDTGVVWVYGIGVAERVAVDKNTKKAIEFITHNK
ncbi:MAG: tRNA lysidine(34) synthetase TilS [Clostridia bacterium]|nr:tRNA lysidine(34) synthetase TilS [Clostridia bacterium]